MQLNRSLAAALALPLVAAGALVVGSTQTATAARHDVAASTQRVATGPLIQGVVADASSGRYLDDVEVHAVGADGTVASDFTYASQRDDGPQHGYFFLPVPRGTYDVVLSKAGYESQTITDVPVTRRHPRFSLGEVDLEPRPVATRTAASLRSATITTADRGRMTVTVATPATRRPTGAVQVRIGGRTVGADSLGRADGGSVTVNLHALEPGTYQLKAFYAGSRGQNLAPSSSGTVRLQVLRSRHHH